MCDLGVEPVTWGDESDFGIGVEDVEDPTGGDLTIESLTYDFPSLLDGDDEPHPRRRRVPSYP